MTVGTFSDGILAVVAPVFAIMIKEFKKSRRPGR